MEAGKERAGDAQIAAGKEDEASPGAKGRVFLFASGGFVPFSGEQEVGDGEEGVDWAHQDDGIFAKGSDTDEENCNQDADDDKRRFLQLFKTSKVDKLGDGKSENTKERSVVDSKEEVGDKGGAEGKL